MVEPSFVYVERATVIELQILTSYIFNQLKALFNRKIDAVYRKAIVNQKIHFSLYLADGLWGRIKSSLRRLAGFATLKSISDQEHLFDERTVYSKYFESKL